MKITPPTSSQPPTHTPGYIGAITDRVKSDLVKQENEKCEKIPKPRKKRGQYKKTILRQQAEAAAAAAAAGLPPPQFPPLPDSKRTSFSAAHFTSNSKTRGGESSTASTVESLEVRSHMPNHDHATSPTTLEMERELAMLAEEAEEDRRRREEEAADRILKRAQVVKHLRSLKSKLATAQIQIGHDLHYQSIDLFSQLYDEVLEDIGRDNNSEMLNLLKNSTQDQLNQDSDPESSEIAAHHSGHMLTRSSDRPRKKDLIPTTSRIPSGASRSHSSDHKSHVIDLDVDSDSDSVLLRRNRRNKSSSQFVGQSWNIGSGRDEPISTPSSSSFNSRPRPNQRITRMEEEEEEEEEGPNISSPRKSHGATPSNLSLASQTRGELQFKHRRELEQLQSQQRKDQEEFQRKQLEQLRELQLRQNEEIEEFEEDKARRYKEHMEGLAEKRLKISQSLYSRKGEINESRVRRKELYSSNSLSYEFDNGFQSHSQDDSPSHSRSPSPSPPPPQHLSRQTLDPQVSGPLLTSSPNHALSSRNASTSSPAQSSKTHRINGSINPLPMSTMTLALTAMNEKKKQLKRAMKKQLEQEDIIDNDVELSGQDEQHSGTTDRRFLSPPIWSQKRSAPENTTAFKRSPSISNSSIAKPSTLPVLLQRQQSPTGHHSMSYHSSSQTSNDVPLSHLSHTHTQVGSLEGSPSPSPNLKLKKRKSPASPPPKASYGAIPSEATTKSAIGFNKTLLSHFEKWNPDDKAGDFFDFVLSDPPDIDVGDVEVEDMLNGENHPTDQKDHHDLNATPTSNAFKWFQEQQKLAQELARQPKIAPLRLTEGDGDEGTGTEVSHDSMSVLQLGNEAYDGLAVPTELIPGEDPLAAFIQHKRRPHESRKHASVTTTSATTARIGDNEHEENSRNQTSQQIGNASNPSPFLSSSPGMLLYSEGNEGDWGFQPFSIDPTDEYLHHDAPLEGNKGYASLNF
ncbi:hypothetical protein BGX26_000144 [Mortierella sp. AD094]|nr:hypothetical protein BGX26_000144 [Mortierella sp. AD094]